MFKSEVQESKIQLYLIDWNVVVRPAFTTPQDNSKNQSSDNKAKEKPT
jgi:hypothetical protein